MHHYLLLGLENYIQEAVIILFQLCFIIQLYFLVNNHSRLSAYKPVETHSSPAVPVSVIISARNEAFNLKVNLPVVLEQQYPDFEVVVINDCSSDASDSVLMQLKEQYPHLKIVTITEHARFKTGKKFALTLGIKAALHEHLLLTDADCMPASARWISQMAANFTSQVQIVLGYSPYNKALNFINPFIRFETIKTGISYLSAAYRGRPYMGIGRNLAYTKALFFSAKGFAAHMHVMAGDDDLFVNQNATPENTVIEISPDAFTFSEAKSTVKAWFRQKRRHMGVGKLYAAKDRKLLSVDAISGSLFYILLTICIVFNFEPWLALGLFMFRLIFQLLIYNRLFKRLNGEDLVWYLPFFDVIYYFYLNILGLIGAFIKNTTWK